MQFNSYLHFAGQCEEAFTFYQKCLGGKINGFFRYESGPSMDNVPAEWRNKVMHAHMTIGDQSLMGCDPPPAYFQKPQGFSVNIGVKDVAEGKRYFEALCEGGKISMPFGPTFWSAGFGMLVDRYGIPWMINVDQPA